MRIPSWSPITAALLAGQAKLELANVLAIPRAPKAARRKTDTPDTARLRREHRAGTLPRSFQPRPSRRRLRRLVGPRQDPVKRRTAVRNGFSRCLGHETGRSVHAVLSQGVAFDPPAPRPRQAGGAGGPPRRARAPACEIGVRGRERARVSV